MAQPDPDRHDSGHTARPRAPAPRRPLGPARHHHGVLRLPAVRHAGRARVQQAVLPEAGPRGRHDRLLRHLHRRLSRPPDRRPDHRPFRRPDRPAVHAAGHHDHDGPGQLPDRRAAHVQRDRYPGPGPARRAAHRPGLRARRRMGRRGPDDHRTRRQPAARVLEQLHRDGSAARLAAVHPRRARGVLDAARAVPRLGLAHPVSAEHPAARGRALRARTGPGEPPVRRAQARTHARAASCARRAAASAQPGADHRPRPRPAGHPGTVEHVRHHAGRGQAAFLVHNPAGARHRRGNLAADPAHRGAPVRPARTAPRDARRRRRHCDRGLPGCSG